MQRIIIHTDNNIIKEIVKNFLLLEHSFMEIKTYRIEFKNVGKPLISSEQWKRIRTILDEQ